jgi:SAM-dependent methyltransferase
MICRICKKRSSPRTYRVREMMFGSREAFEYFQCPACRCLQITTIPSDLSKYYPEEYYSYRHAKGCSRIKKILIVQRNRYAVFHKGWIGGLLDAVSDQNPLRFLYVQPVNKNARILDVGCGSGAVLNSLKELGFANLSGIDPYIAADAATENGILIQKTELSGITGKWDLIMFHHSFEHLPNPGEILRRVSDLLHQDGYAVIRTPTVSSFAWRCYGVNWVQLDAPRHLYLHSTESMKRLCAESGLEVFHTVFDSTAFQFWGSELYLKDIPLFDGRSPAVSRKSGLFSRKEMARFSRRAGKVNAGGEGDQAVFYIRKIRRTPGKKSSSRKRMAELPRSDRPVWSGLKGR